MSKFETIIVNGEEVLYNFTDKDSIVQLLECSNNVASLFIKDKNTGKTIKDDCFQNMKTIPPIEDIIVNKGYDVHTFEECENIYGEMFENDDSYLPFDFNEIFISLNDNYQGCCTKEGWEFSTKDFHYFIGIIKNKK
jgi:hypothetical protein